MTLIVTLRRTALGMAALAALSLACLSSGQAADWPSRPVTVIVPMAAGGNTDMMARMAADHLTSKLGQPFVVDNRPSAGGALAAGFVAGSPPDGHTILFSPSTVLLLTPQVQKINFDPNQLRPVTNVGTGVQVVAVRKDLPVNSIPEFVAHAKANPGKLNFAIAGAQNLSHLGPILLFKLAGVELTMVPSRGEPQAIADLVAGNVDFYFGNASILLEQAKAGKVKLLAVGTAQRIAPAPELPTVAETYPSFVFASWNGFSVPTGTPDAVVDKLRDEIIAMAKSPEVVKKLSGLGIVPGGQTKDEVASAFKLDRANITEAVKAAGITPP